MVATLTFLPFYITGAITRADRRFRFFWVLGLPSGFAVVGRTELPRQSQSTRPAGYLGRSCPCSVELTLLVFCREAVAAMLLTRRKTDNGGLKTQPLLSINDLAISFTANRRWCEAWTFR